MCVMLQPRRSSTSSTSSTAPSLSSAPETRAQPWPHATREYLLFTHTRWSIIEPAQPPLDTRHCSATGDPQGSRPVGEVATSGREWKKRFNDKYNISFNLLQFNFFFLRCFCMIFPIISQNVLNDNLVQYIKMLIYNF